MNCLKSLLKWQIGLPALSVLGLCFIPSIVLGDEQDGSGSNSTGIGALADHDHAPILIRSKPVIERLPVQVIEPVDLCVSAGGVVYVADRRAQVVFRLQPDGQTDLIATELDGVKQILVDTDQILYILTSSQGSGRVIYVTPSGRTGEACSVDFAPVGFARDQTGAFILSAASGRTVLTNGLDEYSELAKSPESIVDVVVTTADQIHVLLTSGKVAYLGRDSSTATAGYVGTGATRLFPLPNGHLAALHPVAAEQRTMISVMSRTSDSAEAPQLFAQVPVGTVAVAFDSLGNMCLANPDLRAITKITSRFVVPCPHCSRPLSMILSMDAPEPEPAGTLGSRRRGF